MELLYVVTIAFAVTIALCIDTEETAPDCWYIIEEGTIDTNERKSTVIVEVERKETRNIEQYESNTGIIQVYCSAVRTLTRASEIQTLNKRGK